MFAKRLIKYIFPFRQEILLFLLFYDIVVRFVDSLLLAYLKCMRICGTVNGLREINDVIKRTLGL